MPERAKFYAAQMRWSDRHVGTEITPLRIETGEDARRGLRRHLNANGAYGLLIQDELERDGYGEGHGVIVIALPRRMADEEIIAARDRIAAALAHDAEVNGG